MSDIPTFYPVKLELAPDDQLLIEWSDAKQSRITFQRLRENCPCAHCRVAARNPPKAELLPVISTAEAQPLTIEGMKPLGNYAYVIHFSDGHDSGIYEFSLLRSLGTNLTS